TTSENSQVAMADHVVKAIVAHVMDLIEELLPPQVIPIADPSKVNEISVSFLQSRPVDHAGSLTNILNAGWQVYFSRAYMELKQETERKDSVLYDLVLKSLEILDIEETLQEVSNP
ncbi:MAG: hypothetical protein ABI743_10425, partial [bacterium]